MADPKAIVSRSVSAMGSGYRRAHRVGRRQLAPTRARELIEAGAKAALSDLAGVPPHDPGF